MNYIFKIIGFMAEIMIMILIKLYEVMVMMDGYITGLSSAIYMNIEDYLIKDNQRTDKVSFHQGARHLWIVIRLFLFITYVPFSLPFFMIRWFSDENTKEKTYEISRIMFYLLFIWGLVRPYLFWGIKMDSLDAVILNVIIGFNPLRAAAACLYYKVNYELKDWLEIVPDDIEMQQEDDEIVTYEEKGER